MLIYTVLMLLYVRCSTLLCVTSMLMSNNTLHDVYCLKLYEMIVININNEVGYYCLKVIWLHSSF